MEGGLDGGLGGLGGEHKVLASYKAKAATEEGREVSASEGKEEEEMGCCLIFYFDST